MITPSTFIDSKYVSSLWSAKMNLWFTKMNSPNYDL